MKSESLTDDDRTAETPGAARPRGKRWKGILQIIISAAILAWLLYKVGPRSIVAALEGLNLWLYGLAGLVLVVSIAARALRWYTLLTPLGVKASLYDLFKLYLIGFFWNSFLPSGFGGDIVKAIELRRTTGRGVASVISVLAERIVGLFATALVGLLIIPIWPRLFPPEAIIVVVVMCGGFVIGMAVVRIDLPGWLGKRLPRLRPITGHRWVVTTQQALNTYTLGALGISLLASIPFTLLSILDSYLVGIAMGIDLSIIYYAIYTPIISLISLLPLSFNGLGVREYTYQVLFGMVGVPPEQAIAMALIFNLLRFGAGILGGLVSLLSGFSRLKESGETI